MTKGNEEPEVTRATRSETGRDCPLCRFPIKERESIVICDECGSPHHIDCWEEEGGCSKEGCSGGKGAAPVPSASPERNRPHVPPKSGPTGKKRKRERLRVTPDPRPKQRKREPARAGGTAKPTGSSGGISRTLWTVGTVAVLAAFIGILLVANSDNTASGKECEEGTGVDGIPCYTNGALPNIPQGETGREVGRFLRNWYRTLSQEKFGTAWELLSERKRAQIQQNRSGRFPRGKQSWIDGQREFAKFLNPTGLQVDLVEPSYPKDGVLSVNIRNLPYDDPRDRCGFRGGITWVKYEPGEDMWYYEPGIDVTNPRKSDWSGRSGSIFRNSC